MRGRDPAGQAGSQPLSDFPEGREQAVGRSNIYEGYAIYLGPDERPFGIVHGKRYEIEVTVLKSGRCRVSVVNSAISPFKMTYENLTECWFTWKQVRSPGTKEGQ